MSPADKATLQQVVALTFALIHTKCEITALVVKNQNAPKYMYEQARDIQDRISWIIENSGE